ncbi:MAG: MaoC family dehydratase [Gammaproteobacteria bacterium]|nr:MaoC family dehydratase [Gammaproteobacteria bacterium]
MNKTIPAADLPSLAGAELEPSSWLKISQERVDRFADATNDHQFIHVDTERAAQTPFGGTIAHGYLTLSLLPYLTAETTPLPEGLQMAINYGSDRVRFVQAVRVGQRVRARQKVLDVVEKNPGQWQIRTRVSVDIEGQERPALIADVLALYVTAPAGD